MASDTNADRVLVEAAGRLAGMEAVVAHWETTLRLTGMVGGSATAAPLPPAPLPAAASPYLTVPEAAAHLRSTPNTVYDWVKRRLLHPVPGVKGRLLFTRDALDRFLTTRRRR